MKYYQGRWYSQYSFFQCEIINPYQSCGEVNQSRVVYCMDAFSPRKSPVHSIWCNSSTKPIERQKCKIPCMKWMTSSWSSVSKTFICILWKNLCFLLFFFLSTFKSYHLKWKVEKKIKKWWKTVWKRQFEVN